jgi:hypothetical protein
MTDDEVKCVHPLPVITTGTCVPAEPAPGETTATAACGGVAIADPVSEPVTGEPIAAESAIVSTPVRVLGVVALGVKFTKIVHVPPAAIEPDTQPVLAV